MAAKPGEENVATIFSDVHYYYSSPAQNPPHHRFDKGSYVYLFENAQERRARVEIANNAGTDDQDAVEGYLDKAYLRYSYKHQCLVSLTAPEASDPSEWHLPTYDPRNENKYHYKLHSIDLYFYTQTDALQFVSGIRRVLPPAQVEIRDEPPPPPPPQQQQLTRAPVGAGASAVVQQLERVALGEPQQPAMPANFTPMAYNPAAPAAPESIRPREKTPPPEDGGIDPLAAAVAYDQQPFSPGFPPPPPPPGPPQQQPFGQPHPGGLQRSSTMPVHAAGITSQQGLASPYAGSFQAQQGYAPQQPQQPAGLPQSHGSTPPAVGTPGAPPPAGPPQAAYAVHQQGYRPDQAEQQAMGKQARMEEHAGRLERGVGGMFKKLEKRFG